MQVQGLPIEGCFKLAVAQKESRFASSKSDDNGGDDDNKDNTSINDHKPAARERDEVPDWLTEIVMGVTRSEGLPTKGELEFAVLMSDDEYNDKVEFAASKSDDNGGYNKALELAVSNSENDINRTSIDDHKPAAKERDNNSDDDFATISELDISDKDLPTCISGQRHNKGRPSVPFMGSVPDVYDKAVKHCKKYNDKVS